MTNYIHKVSLRKDVPTLLRIAPPGNTLIYVISVDGSPRVQLLERVYQHERAGFNSEPVHSFPRTDKWIPPAPKASGLRRKRQCGVPPSYGERQKTTNVVLHYRSALSISNFSTSFNRPHFIQLMIQRVQAWPLSYL
jgi:hypothetical protein